MISNENRTAALHGLDGLAVSVNLLHAASGRYYAAEEWTDSNVDRIRARAAADLTEVIERLTEIRDRVHPNV